MTCDHKFIDSNQCAKCGVSVGTLRTELASLKQSIAGTCHRETVGCDANEHAAEYANEALAEAISILRDWEDYDPDDPECTWGTRRDEFLEKYEVPA